MRVIGQYIGCELFLCLMLTMDFCRWCPPNQEFNIEKGIWAAVGAVGMSPCRYSVYKVMPELGVTDSLRP